MEPRAAPALSPKAHRLFRQDWLIAFNTIRATLANWSDRTIAALMALTVLAMCRTWFADRAWTIAASAALAVGAMIGMAAGRLVATRLAFHASDGLLASDALHPRIRRLYIGAWHGIGMALLAAATSIVRPSLLVITVPAYLTGVLVGWVTKEIGMPGRIAGATRQWRMIGAWAHRPIAGIIAAEILILSLSSARAIGPNALIAIAGLEAVLLATMLTRVDDAIVRFMTIAGHGPWSIIRQHTGAMAAFLAVGVPGSGLMLGWAVAGIVAAAGAALLLLLGLRVLAYRLHARRFADFLVTLLCGLVILIAYSVPVALPVIVLVMLWRLGRRGRAKTWLLT